MNFQTIQKAVRITERHTKRYLASRRLQEECNVKLRNALSAKEFFNENVPRENSTLKDNAPLNFQISSLPRSYSPTETTTHIVVKILFVFVIFFFF